MINKRESSKVLTTDDGGSLGGLHKTMQTNQGWYDDDHTPQNIHNMLTLVRRTECTSFKLRLST